MTTSGEAPKAYVIGAGLSGLSAATILAARGVSVTLMEAAGQAGGRCRSYFDSVMDGVIDNGNHLVLSGNRAVHAYLERIGARDVLTGPRRAEFAFVDVRGGKTGFRIVTRKGVGAGEAHGPICGGAQESHT